MKYENKDKSIIYEYGKNLTITCEYHYLNNKLYKINEYKKGIINWGYIYKFFNYDIEFLVRHVKELTPYMTREDKIKVFEYKMKRYE